MKVLKFGGTSMGTAEAMRASAARVRSQALPLLVVVSATSGTTNQLLKFAQSGLPQNVDEIVTRHEGLVRELGLTDLSLENHFMRLRQGVGRAGLSPQELDALLAEGETLSAEIFAALLKSLGLEAQFSDVREVLRTNSHFGKAEPDLEALQRLAPKFWGQGPAKVWVTQGFVGADSEQRTTTLGRGGSDYSAALLGEALRAQEVQIWTDVPGISSTDPRWVPAARRIEELSFSEAAELAAFGAKVLHPATVWPALRANIPVFVGSTFEPQAGGTWIRKKVEGEQPPVQAIALRKNQTLVTVTSPRMLNAYGFLAQVFGVLAKHRLSVDLVTTSEVSVALTVDALSSGSSSVPLRERPELLRDLREFGDLSIEEDLTLVAVIGNGLSSTPGLGAQIFETVQPTNVRLICHGASPHNICFLVAAGDAPAVLKKLHQKLIESQ